MTSPRMKIVVVTGPTATGKTRLGVSLARRFDGEIVSADSRQVYRGMDLGTGKDLADFGEGEEAIAHHLIDIVSPLDDYNVHQFQRDANRAIDAIVRRGRLPLVVGGSPLYLHALLRDYRLPGGRRDEAFRAELAKRSDDALLAELETTAPNLFERVDKTQRARVVRALEIAHSADAPPPKPALRRRQLEALVLAPYYPRATVHARIETRLRERLRDGLLDEVQRLHREGVSWERLERFGLEYRYAARHLQGQLEETAFFDALFTHIRRFCKSQDAWFRKMEREGQTIYWLPEGDLSAANDLVETFLAGGRLPPATIKLSEIVYGPLPKKRLTD